MAPKLDEVLVFDSKIGNFISKDTLSTPPCFKKRTSLKINDPQQLIYCIYVIINLFRSICFYIAVYERRIPNQKFVERLYRLNKLIKKMH